jgi:transposase-like protein
MADAILNQPHFTDPDKAREYLEALRWPNGAVCPHCGSTGDHYQLQGKAHRPGLWKCHDCREQFTITVGTVFERSKIALNVWLQAVHFISSSKKGMSSHQLHRTLGVTYKTAWFISHRIREAMKDGSMGPLGGGGKVVEADDTYWGNVGKQKKGARGGDHKMKIVSLIERDGKKRSFHVANVTAETVTPILKKHIAKRSRLHTDEAKVYNEAGLHFKTHETVNHSAKEYAYGDVTTNTAESSFAILKRGLYGTFHHVSEAHLQRYATEFDFRWNHRAKMGFNDKQRADAILKGIAGKRLMYRDSSQRPAI